MSLLLLLLLPFLLLLLLVVRIRQRQEESSRAASPLEPAKDAHIIDTSALDADQVFAQALEIVGASGADEAFPRDD